MRIIRFPFCMMHSIDQGHGKGESGSAIPAGDGNILAVAAYDGLDDVQAKTPAIPVLGPGFIQLMEPVKDQRQLLRGNGVTLIGDGNIDLGGSLPDGQSELAPLGTEFTALSTRL